MVGNHQPAKLAAFEGLFETGPARLSIIGWPNAETQKTDFEIGIPGMLSFLAKGDLKSPVIGLDRIPKDYWPPLKISFLSYHLMVAIGTFLIGLTLLGSFFRWRGTLFEKRWILWMFVSSVVLALVANEIGWVAAEVGRQPWVVYPPLLKDASGEYLLNAQGQIQYLSEQGLLTRNAVSEAVHSGEVLTSIILFSLIYLLLFGVWIFVLNHKIHLGPEPYRRSTGSTSEGILEAASMRIEHDQSMTESKKE
jgi:cytochrome d ubiquinol oxidase subunit I